MVDGFEGGVRLLQGGQFGPAGLVTRLRAGRREAALRRSVPEQVGQRDQGHRQVLQSDVQLGTLTDVAVPGHRRDSVPALLRYLTPVVHRHLAVSDHAPISDGQTIVGVGKPTPDGET
jgi:hypothetical protein